MYLTAISADTALAMSLLVSDTRFYHFLIKLQGLMFYFHLNFFDFKFNRPLQTAEDDEMDVKSYPRKQQIL